MLQTYGEHQVGIRYRTDEKTGREVIATPTEWLVSDDSLDSG